MARTKRQLRAVGIRLRRASKDLSPAEKALYHAELGAGRSHVKRDFFGLTRQDEEVLRGLVQAHLRTLA